MINAIDNVVNAISGVLYQPYVVPLLLMLAGIYFTIRTRLLQFRLFGESIRVVKEKPVNLGATSSFGALMVSTASRVGTGAVASLDYARTLTESALLLISQPVGLAVLSSAKPKEPSDQIESIARPILALAVPASAFLFMFAPDIVRLVFFRGAFNEQAVILTSQALQGISCGLWAATLGWILIRILNGTGRNFVAALIIVIAYLVNIGINLLTSYLPHISESGTLLLGLGEATRGIVLLAGVMMVLKSRKKLLFWLFLASIPAVLMILSGWQIHAWFAGSWQRLFVGSVACLVCIALAFAMLLPNAYVAAFARLRSRF